MKRRSDSATASIDAVSLAAAVDLLGRRAGLVFPDSRHAAVRAAMARVATETGVRDPVSLLALLDESGAVFDDFVAEVTVGESYFFRESAQFDLLRARILPELVATNPKRKIRVWSAASSTGEEAYSLAIALIEEGVDGEVLGTDISRPRLAAARRAAYREWSMRGVSEATIARWFKRDGDQLRLSPAVRQRATFRYLNLADDRYPAISTGVWGMDLIFCRNVLIYFDPATVEAVIRKLISSLSEDGWLLLGATDPPLPAGVDACIVDTAAGLAYRRSGSASGRRNRNAVRDSGAIRAAEPLNALPPSPMREPAHQVPSPSLGGTTPALPLIAPHETGDSAAAAYARRDYPAVIALVGTDRSSQGVSNDDQVLLVRALANLGRLDEAGRACAAALDVQRDSSELHYLHSVLLMESGRPLDAASAGRRALYLDRELIVAHLAVATANTRAGDPESADRALSAAERLLARMEADEIVPASDGERAGRLLAMTRVQRRLIGAGVP